MPPIEDHQTPNTSINTELTTGPQHFSNINIIQQPNMYNLFQSLMPSFVRGVGSQATFPNLGPSPELLFQLATSGNFNLLQRIEPPNSGTELQISDGTKRAKATTLTSSSSSLATMSVNRTTSAAAGISVVASTSGNANQTVQQHQQIQMSSQAPLNSYVQNHFMSADRAYNLDLVPKQAPSPIAGFRTAKNEPSSSSSSQPGTPVQGGKRAVPACAICGTDSTGIHFGVDACAACSAFFRRTVVLNKHYSCNKGGQCVIVKDGAAGQKCRACRFKKCLSSGMDRNSVQHRRDAIGKYSAGVKREITPDPEIEPPPKIVAQSRPNSLSNGVSNSPQPQERVQATPFQYSQNVSGPKSVLLELINRQKFLLEQRQLFYSDNNLEDWFRKPVKEEDGTLSELTSFSNCMYHLWKVEPRLAADFINRNRFLEEICEKDKVKIFRNFVVVRQAVEEPYMTWKHGGLQKNWFVMPNRTYLDFTDPEKYFRNGVLKDLKLDMQTAKNLFLPSFLGAMDSVGCLMQNLRITETEMIVLLGLVLLDPGVGGLEEKTRRLLKEVRDQLIQEVFVYYEDEVNVLEPEIRIADLFMILAAIKIHAIKTSENMHILGVFDLIPHDKCFDQIMRNDSSDVTDLSGIFPEDALQPTGNIPSNSTPKNAQIVIVTQAENRKSPAL